MKPTKEQILDCDDEQQLNEWLAEICMGWRKQEDDPFYFSGWFLGCECKSEVRDWQPLAGTDKGRSQAIGLAEKYELTISFCKLSDGNFIVLCPLDDSIREINQSWQIAVAKAAIISELGV